METVSKNKDYQNDLEGLSSGRSSMLNILKLKTKTENISSLKQNIHEVFFQFKFIFYIF